MGPSYLPSLTIPLEEGYQNHVPTTIAQSTIQHDTLAALKQYNVPQQLRASGRPTVDPGHGSKPSATKTRNDKASGTATKFKKVQDIYDVAASQGKSSSPHKAPQYRITELKNQILKVKNNTEDVKRKIEEIDNRYKKINNNSKYLNQQTFQCEADKLEVLRDLSQYEYNYSQQSLPF